MAKTTSEIIAENKAKRAEAEKISASLDAIHQRQMAEVGEKNAQRTEAVLNGTSDKLVKTEETVNMDSFLEISASPVICAAGGFILGCLVAFVFFRRKIKKIKYTYDTRLEEARASLDRMLVIASKNNSI